MSEKKIGAAQFKEQCLKLLETVDKDGLVITKNGKPVAKLIPYTKEQNSYIGRFSDVIQIYGDTKNTGTKWNAES